LGTTTPVEDVDGVNRRSALALQASMGAPQRTEIATLVVVDARITAFTAISAPTYARAQGIPASWFFGEWEQLL